jgi:hypothetical protein
LAYNITSETSTAKDCKQPSSLITYNALLFTVPFCSVLRYYILGSFLKFSKTLHIAKESYQNNKRARK